MEVTNSLTISQINKKERRKKEIRTTIYYKFTGQFIFYEIECHVAGYILVADAAVSVV
jgi:hypothetical protein